MGRFDLLFPDRSARRAPRGASQGQSAALTPGQRRREAPLLIYEQLNSATQRAAWLSCPGVYCLARGDWSYGLRLDTCGGGSAGGCSAAQAVEGWYGVGLAVRGGVEL